VLRSPAGRALIDVRDPAFGATPLGWCSHGARNSGKRDADYSGVARLLIAAGARVEPRMLEEDLPDDVQAAFDEASSGGRQ
jgi:hypothetical protein